MLDLVPGIHEFLDHNLAKTWMAGTSPAMTLEIGLAHAVPSFFLIFSAVAASLACSSILPE
jgi:hypothetical protein